MLSILFILYIENTEQYSLMKDYWIFCVAVFVEILLGPINLLRHLQKQEKYIIINTILSMLIRLLICIPVCLYYESNVIILATVSIFSNIKIRV